MEIVDIAGLVISIIAVVFTLTYIIANRIKDASIVDIIWGAVQVIVAIVLLLLVDGTSYVRLLVSLYIVLWGVRLAWHIGSRKLGEPEDKRYQNFRKEWGDTYWWRSILQIYVLQGLLASVMALPLIVVAHPENAQFTDHTWWVAIGSLVWWYGFLFEAIGDWQLRQFIKTKKAGEIMTDGLWQYTRHPNYFGEVTQWWGLWIILVPLAYGWWALATPILITFLILKVSGITMLEKRYKDNKKYQEYKKRTSPFIPMPPKS